ncbi:pectinesterase family protein [Streptomyces sp. NBC_01314]|nr:pectinesterase family protein [Streptomyces sp. NBC_01314]
MPYVVRVFIRRSDTYVLGWRAGRVTALNTIAWGTFYNLYRNTATTTYAPLPGSTVATTSTRYDGLENYNDLLNQGANRLGMGINPSSLSNAVRILNDATDLAVSVVAPAILQIIVALAEGARLRQQARETATAFRNGQTFFVTQTHMAFQNGWGTLSKAVLTAVAAGSAALLAPVEIAGIVIVGVAMAANYLMLAHHSGVQSQGRRLAAGSLLHVSLDGDGDYWTVQAAIDAVPDGGTNTITISKGVYHEVISVPASKSWLTIQGVGGAADVVIYNTRAHGMLNPATGAKYGTQGSAVATFRPPNLTVENLTISNTFDSAAHPEIDPYETQAVAIAAMGDRQTYSNVNIYGRQDTLYVKGETPTTQARQYFVNCYIRGTVDFVFGNATAVIDRSKLQMIKWPGGTLLAPSTDYRKKYGILITDSEVITTDASPRTMHLGRPWHNTPDAWPQAVVRNTMVWPHVDSLNPWVDMMPDYPWEWARLKEYNNSSYGAGVGANAPKLTATEAADYTAQKYLAGTDGWNPVR